MIECKNVYVCDRCGKKSEEPSFLHTGSYKGIYRTPDRSTIDVEWEFDLCLSCSKKLSAIVFKETGK